MGKTIHVPMLYKWRDRLVRIDDRFSPSRRRLHVYVDYDRFNPFTGEQFPAGWSWEWRTAVPITDVLTGEQSVTYKEELRQYVCSEYGGSRIPVHVHNPSEEDEKGEDD